MGCSKSKMSCVHTATNDTSTAVIITTIETRDMNVELSGTCSLMLN